MNHGDIIEQGTHLQLLSQNGFYAELYRSQFEKPIVDVVETTTSAS
jgi:ATP-binding cassette subfamily B protein